MSEVLSRQLTSTPMLALPTKSSEKCRAASGFASLTGWLSAQAAQMLEQARKNDDGLVFSLLYGYKAESVRGLAYPTILVSRPWP